MVPGVFLNFTTKVVYQSFIALKQLYKVAVVIKKHARQNQG